MDLSCFYYLAIQRELKFVNDKDSRDISKKVSACFYTSEECVEIQSKYEVKSRTIPGKHLDNLREGLESFVPISPGLQVLVYFPSPQRNWIEISWMKFLEVINDIWTYSNEFWVTTKEFSWLIDVTHEDDILFIK